MSDQSFSLCSCALDVAIAGSVVRSSGNAAWACGSGEYWRGGNEVRRQRARARPPRRVQGLGSTRRRRGRRAAWTQSATPALRGAISARPYISTLARAFRDRGEGSGAALVAEIEVRRHDRHRPMIDASRPRQSEGGRSAERRRRWGGQAGLDPDVCGSATPRELHFHLTQSACGSGGAATFAAACHSARRTRLPARDRPRSSLRNEGATRLRCREARRGLCCQGPHQG